MIIGIIYISNDTYSHHSNGMYDNRAVFSKLKFLRYLEILMSKLQPGGLAMIISANVSDNIGKIVELINFLGPSKSDVSGEVAPAWYVKCESGLLTTEGDNIMRAGIFSRRLMPLSGQDKLHSHLHEMEMVNG